MDGLEQAKSVTGQKQLGLAAGLAAQVNSTGTGRRIARGRKGRGKIAFGWYGGKYSHLDFILPHLPRDAQHFCDVFGGSAAVLLNTEPYPVETYNDVDSELVNFFETLRNQNGKLIKQISLTPFSREELMKACATEEGLTKLERARRFFVRARQTRTGLAQKSSEGRWAHCVLTSRAGMAGAVSRWLGSVEGLPEIVQRLQRVQIENAPAIEIIERYDTDQTVFYADPPYVHATRGDAAAYGYEMTDEDHRELARTLGRIRGRAVVSGYANPLYEDLYEGWCMIRDKPTRCAAAQGHRVECLWKNF